MTAGGALMTTTEVENFPGFPDGIMGPALMDDLRKQAEKFGAELISDDATALELEGDIKVVRDSAGNEHRALTVILAMGSSYRKLGLPNEEALSGHGVSWCATCDGFFFRDQQIAVVGGGDSAVEEATFLSRFASKVTIVHRRDQLRASAIMAAAGDGQRQDRVRLEQRGRRDHRRRPARGHPASRHVTGERRRIDVTGLFIAIGHDPRSELVRDQVDA